MKYFLIFISILLFDTPFAQDQERPPVAVKYSLNLEFDKVRQKIIAHFNNKSDMDLKIQRDLNAPSFLTERISFFSFRDTENLTRIPVYFLAQSDPNYVLINSNGHYDGKINLFKSPKDYCGILNKSPIIIFWFYGHRDNKYRFARSQGAFRITKSDVKC